MLENVRLGKVVFGTLAALSLILCWLARSAAYFPGDLPVTLALQSVYSEPLLTVMKWLGYVTGNWRGAVLVIIAGVVFWRSRGALEGGMILLSGLFTAVNEALKMVVNRPRPAADLVDVFVVETEKSFPSGHAFFAVAVLGLMAYLIVTHQTQRRAKVLVVSAFVALMLLIGASRIYLGVHWVSDVLGGYLVGALFLMLEVRLYRRLKPRFAIDNRISCDRI